MNPHILETAGPHAARIESLWWVFQLVCGAVFVAVLAAFLLALWRGHRGVRALFRRAAAPAAPQREQKGGEHRNEHRPADELKHPPQRFDARGMRPRGFQHVLVQGLSRMTSGSGTDRLSLRPGRTSFATSPLIERTYATSCHAWSSEMRARKAGMPFGRPSMMLA
ncbi:MAG TPA: hypothetical protein VHG88_03375, partial [Burkholderiales bacterium]|nr:hypothetical protein [Burkholderiales bacterium]